MMLSFYLIFGIMSFCVGVIYGVMLCSLIWTDAENRKNSSKKRKWLCYTISGIFMGCAFLSTALYLENCHNIETLVVFMGLVFLATYAIQDMIELAVYEFLLNLGVCGMVFMKTMIYVFDLDFSGLLSFFAMSAAMYVALKVISKGFPKLMGEGDYDILFIVFLLCGENGLVQVMFISSLIGAVSIAGMLLFGKANMKDKVPLAPILYLGTLMYFI